MINITPEAVNSLIALLREFRDCPGAELAKLRLNQEQVVLEMLAYLNGKLTQAAYGRITPEEREAMLVWVVNGGNTRS